MSKESINDVLKAPEWTMADAYGDIEDERYRASFAEAEAIVEGLEATADRPVAATEIQAALDC